MLSQVKQSRGSTFYALNNNMMSHQKGFSLIELLVVIGIVGIITSIAIPAFDTMIQRNRLKAALQSVQDDLQLARTQAIKQSRNVVFSIKRKTGTTISGDTWCYGLTVNASCNCDPNDDGATTDSTCEIKTVSSASFIGARFQTDTVSNIAFDFRRGTTTATELPFSSSSTYRSDVYVDAAGRVRMCLPNPFPTGGELALPKLANCT